MSKVEGRRVCPWEDCPHGSCVNCGGEIAVDAIGRSDVCVKQMRRAGVRFSVMPMELHGRYAGESDTEFEERIQLLKELASR